MAFLWLPHSLLSLFFFFLSFPLSYRFTLWLPDPTRFSILLSRPVDSDTHTFLVYTGVMPLFVFVLPNSFKHMLLKFHGGDHCSFLFKQRHQEIANFKFKVSMRFIILIHSVSYLVNSSQHCGFFDTQLLQDDLKARRTIHSFAEL
ncbi:hypothetical protein BDV25DRAFT_54590 [Aspergillus avenaceus]|uniref:Uncharacterized protein n=1 Tax=Aspergillus avenaceus TaxID=36643 RepID=A0A5N6TJD9_ASPAV|nr:hypothetical protein BDV25DRAFT_54590 [Aspergillus avenaceus]